MEDPKPPTRPAGEPRPETARADPKARTDVRLSRDLTFGDATMLGVGALMGGGVFVLLGIATGVAGNALILAFFLNGLITIPTLMVYAELGSAFHDAGGGYLWIKSALGQPLGFLGGWMSWFSHTVACALYSIASAAFVMYITNGAGWTSTPDHGPVVAFGHVMPVSTTAALQILAVLIAGLFVFLNYVGVKVSVKGENLVTSIVMVGVIVFIGFGLWDVFHNLHRVQQNFTPFFPGGHLMAGLSGVALAMGITFIAYEGYEIIAQSSEEVENPGKNIPRAHWTSLYIVWAVILLVTLIVLGATYYPGAAHAWEHLKDSKELAVIVAAKQIMPYGAALIVACSLLLQLMALNATIYSSSRVSFAMGRDGNLPPLFARVHPKRRTPHNAVWGSGIIIMLMAVLPIESVATSADVMFLLLFLLVNSSYIKLRKTLPKEVFTYRAPLFPYVPLVGIGTKFFLAVYLYKYSPVAWYAVMAWLVVGLGFYYVYTRPREVRTSVELQRHMVLAAPTMTGRRDYRILVPLTNTATVRGLALAARDVAVGKKGEIVFLYTITLPSATPLEAGRKFVAQGQPLLDTALSAVGGDSPCSAIVRIGHDTSRTIRSASQEMGASLVLVGWRGQTGLSSSQLNDLVENPPCDLAIVKVVNTPPPRRILQPSGAGAHSRLALSLAGAIATAREATIQVLNVVTPAHEEEATDDVRKARTRATIAQEVPSTVQADVEVAHSKLLVSEVLRRSRGQDLLVLGATRQPFWRATMFGNKPEQMAAGFPGSVLMVKSYEGRSVENVRSLFRVFRVFRRLLRPD
ncbi:MAG: amino acid permease [Thermoplasmatota archaeon]